MAIKADDPEDKVYFILPQDVEKLKQHKLDKDTEACVNNVEKIVKLNEQDDEFAHEDIEHHWWDKLWI